MEATNNIQIQSNDLVSLRRAAELCTCSEKTLRRDSDDGKFEFERSGRYLFVRVADLLRTGRLKPDILASSGDDAEGRSVPGSQSSGTESRLGTIDSPFEEERAEIAALHATITELRAQNERLYAILTARAVS